MPISDPVKVKRAGVRAKGQETKNEAGQFNITQPQAQARPCLIVLAARPGNLHERCFSVSGTESHFQFIGTEEKNDIRNVLQCHYRRQGLEANKSHIKTSFETICPRPTQHATGQSDPSSHPAKNIPSEQITFQGEKYFRALQGYRCGGLSGGGGGSVGCSGWFCSAWFCSA
jgi:hypothetical protein